MINPLSRLKKRLSRVQQDSLHYSITSGIWERTLRTGRVHACKYWWVLFPTSLIIAAVIEIVTVIISIFAIFFGHLPNFEEDNKYDDFFLGHRKKANGDSWPRFIPAPYQVALPILALGFIFFLVTTQLRYTLYGAGGVLGLMVLGGLVTLLLKGWNQPAVKGVREITNVAIGSRWDKICPILVVEPKSTSDPSLPPQDERAS